MCANIQKHKSMQYLCATTTESLYNTALILRASPATIATFPASAGIVDENEVVFGYSSVADVFAEKLPMWRYRQANRSCRQAREQAVVAAFEEWDSIEMLVLSCYCPMAFPTHFTCDLKSPSRHVGSSHQPDFAAQYLISYQSEIAENDQNKLDQAFEFRVLSLPRHDVIVPPAVSWQTS